MLSQANLYIQRKIPKHALLIEENGLKGMSKLQDGNKRQGTYKYV